mmetsp:Transcript_123010/g.292458  ORF Transcript_123010/g.292458 Transcript_123010/m.292458 type:complete len:228 (+) Transcript_123010:68-751(+)
MHHELITPAFCFELLSLMPQPEFVLLVAVPLPWVLPGVRVPRQSSLHGSWRSDMLHLEGKVVQVIGVQLERLLAFEKPHMVDHTAFLGNFLRHELDYGICHEDQTSVLLRHRLQSRCHVDVRTEVGGVDFELGPDRSLDSPATVQSEAHPDSIVGKPLGELWMVAILRQQRRLVNLRDNLDKRDQRHVGQLLLLRRRVAGEPPGQKKGLADVLVRIAEELVDARVDD